MIYFIKCMRLWLIQSNRSISYCIKQSSHSNISSLISVIDTIEDVRLVAESDWNSILEVLELSTIANDLDTGQSNPQAIHSSAVIPVLTLFQLQLVFDSSTLSPLHIPQWYLSYLRFLQCDYHLYRSDRINQCLISYVYVFIFFLHQTLMMWRSVVKQVGRQMFNALVVV